MTSHIKTTRTPLARRFGAVFSLLALLATFFVLMPASPAGAVASPTVLPVGPNGAVAASAVDVTSGITYLGGSFTRWGTQTGSRPPV